MEFKNIEKAEGTEVKNNQENITEEIDIKSTKKNLLERIVIKLNPDVLNNKKTYLSLFTVLTIMFSILTIALTGFFVYNCSSCVKCKIGYNEAVEKAEDSYMFASFYYTAAKKYQEIGEKSAKKMWLSGIGMVVVAGISYGAFDATHKFKKHKQ